MNSFTHLVPHPVLLSNEEDRLHVTTLVTNLFCWNEHVYKEKPSPVSTQTDPTKPAKVFGSSHSHRILEMVGMFTDVLECNDGGMGFLQKWIPSGDLSLENNSFTIE